MPWPMALGDLAEVSHGPPAPSSTRGHVTWCPSCDPCVNVSCASCDLCVSRGTRASGAASRPAPGCSALAGRHEAAARRRFWAFGCGPRSNGRLARCGGAVTGRWEGVIQG